MITEHATRTDEEIVACALGCPPDDEPVVVGHDRLNGVAGQWRVVRCRTCGLMRTSPRPTPDAMAAFYPDDYAPYASSRVDHKTGAPRGRTTGWRRILAPLNHPLPASTRPGRMLEVGCGSGSFLHEMAQRGWDVAGLEFSERAAAAARAHGYPVVTGALETAQPPGDAFDLIAGWMVLEHLHNPVDALRRLRSWANADGWLVLSVPDASAFERRLFGDAWFALQLPTHLFHYTPRTLRAVLRAGGWKAERILWQRNPTNLLRSLRYVAEDRGWRSAATIAGDIASGRRFPRARALLGLALGATRQSGRMTVWARPAETCGMSPGRAQVR